MSFGVVWASAQPPGGVAEVPCQWRPRGAVGGGPGGSELDGLKKCVECVEAACRGGLET